jgi:hypothetical protein
MLFSNLVQKSFTVSRSNFRDTLPYFTLSHLYSGSRLLEQPQKKVNEQIFISERSREKPKIPCNEIIDESSCTDPSATVSTQRNHEPGILLRSLNFGNKQFAIERASWNLKDIYVFDQHGVNTNFKLVSL